MKYLNYIIMAINLIFRLLPTLKHMYEHIIEIYAVVRAELKQVSGNTLVSGEDKRVFAKNILLGFKYFRDKPVKQQNRIIESAWNFVFNKEK